MRSHKALPLALAMGLLAVAPVARGAGSDVQQWSVFTVEQPFAERWKLGLQNRLRIDEDVSRAKDFLIRPFVGFQALDWLALDLGYDYLHQFPSSSRREHRIWQIAQHRWKPASFTLLNRLRLDQRFVEGIDGAILRVRHRIRTIVPLGSRWRAALANEVFVNANEQGQGPVGGFEQNRVRGALAFDTGPLRIEGGYEWIFADRRGNTGEHRHVFFVELHVPSIR